MISEFSGIGLSTYISFLNALVFFLSTHISFLNALVFFLSTHIAFVNTHLFFLSTHAVFLNTHVASVSTCCEELITPCFRGSPFALLLQWVSFLELWDVRPSEILFLSL